MVPSFVYEVHDLRLAHTVGHQSKLVDNMSRCRTERNNPTPIVTVDNATILSKFLYKVFVLV